MVSSDDVVLSSGDELGMEDDVALAYLSDVTFRSNDDSVLQVSTIV